MNVLIILIMIFLVIGIIKVTLLPLKLLIKLILNSCIGLVLLVLFNFIGKGIGMYIVINPVTVILVGILGIPGIVFLMIYTYFTM